MSKITINDETFPYDGSELLLSEAVAIEQGTGLSWGEWQAALVAGTTRGIAGLVWHVWKQNGRHVPLADILNGSVEVTLPVAIEQDGDVSQKLSHPAVANDPHAGQDATPECDTSPAGPEGGEPGGAEA